MIRRAPFELGRNPAGRADNLATPRRSVAMKILRTLLTSFLLLAGLAAVVHAADADPSGKWQWTMHGPQGPITITGEFTLKDGVLSGVVTARGNPAQISHASFTDGVVKFTVVRGESQVHYQGKLAHGVIKGTFDRPGPEGRDIGEWHAKRAEQKIASHFASLPSPRR